MDLAKAKLLLPQLATFSDTDIALLQTCVDNGVFPGNLSSLAPFGPEVKGILSFFAKCKSLTLPS